MLSIVVFFSEIPSHTVEFGVHVPRQLTDHKINIKTIELCDVHVHACIRTCRCTSLLIVMARLLLVHTCTIMCFLHAPCCSQNVKYTMLYFCDHYVFLTLVEASICCIQNHSFWASPTDCIQRPASYTSQWDQRNTYWWIWRFSIQLVVG